MCQISSPSEKLSRRYLLSKFVDFVESVTDEPTDRQRAVNGMSSHTFGDSNNSNNIFCQIAVETIVQLNEDAHRLAYRVILEDISLSTNFCCCLAAYVIILRFVDGKVMPAEELENELHDNKQQIDDEVGV